MVTRKFGYKGKDAINCKHVKSQKKVQAGEHGNTIKTHWHGCQT